MSEKSEYRRILGILAQRIEDGFYLRDGREGRLPSQREMQEEFGVGNTTLRMALVILEDRGVILSEQGKTGFKIIQSGESSGQGRPTSQDPDIGA